MATISIMVTPLGQPGHRLATNVPFLGVPRHVTIVLTKDDGTEIAFRGRPTSSGDGAGQISGIPVSDIAGVQNQSYGPLIADISLYVPGHVDYPVAGEPPNPRSVVFNGTDAQAEGKFNLLLWPTSKHWQRQCTV